MKILGLDTSTEACSVALYINGEIKERHKVAPREHGALVLPMMDELLSEAELKPTQLDALAFGRGPGAFVGVRIAAGVAQGIAFAADLPVVPVSSLAALAQSVGNECVFAAIDARMGEVYWAAYRKNSNGIVELVGEETVCPPEWVPSAPATCSWYGAGTGWGTYGDVLEKRVGGVSGYKSDCYPRAKDTVQIAHQAFVQGDYVDAENALPVYLRNSVAKKPGGKN